MLNSHIDAICLYFQENGYPDTQTVIVFNKVIAIFVERIGNKVFLHFDENYLVLEQPHEMGALGKRPRENFELWVDLNEPNSLPTMLRYVSEITSWGDSPRNSKTQG